MQATKTITGTFQVQLAPLDTYATGENGLQLGRMSIDKTFSGPLSATSKGEMLTGMGTVKGSAGYTAIEQVQGTLEGKKGSFLVQHFGLMSARGAEARLEVIPDSGTGELAGLAGSMQIRIEDGQHFYDFDYAFLGVGA